ncbi:MAG TPA: divergent PAP2 family protein [bacterium]|nr:divergent PAP2 family protein [bacterium]
MKFIIIPLLIWFLSQTAKYFFRLIRPGRKKLKNPLWVYKWAGGAPSTHSAMLTAALYNIAFYNGFDVLFAFGVTVALLFMYNLLEDRQKAEMEEKIWEGKGPAWVDRIFQDGKLLDISGHTFFEVISGIIFGLVMAFVLNKVF